MKTDWDRVRGLLNIIGRCNGHSWTFYMSDAARDFTKEQLDEFSIAFMSGFRAKNKLDCILDFTTPPPY